MVINSEEVLKRLLYILRLEITRNFPNILKYKDYTFLQYYYLDPEDFEYFPNQVVLHDKEQTLKWLKEKSDSIETNKYMLYETIEPSFVQPYFFKNKKINDDRIFIAQNTNSFEKAIKIAIDWVVQKFNPGYYIDINEDNFEYFDCKLFSYENPTTIKNYFVNVNKENSYDIKIIGYKIGDEKYFTTLLK